MTDYTDDLSDVGQVTGAMQALRQIRRQRDLELGVFDEEIRRIKENRDVIAKGYEEKEAQLLSQLQLWCERNRDLDPTFTSLNTPYGSIGSAKQRSSVQLADDEAFERYFTALGDEVPWVSSKVTTSLAKKEVQAAIKTGRIVWSANGKLVDSETGDILDWMIVTQPTDNDRNWSFDTGDQA